MKRAPLLILVAVVVASVAGVRVLLRDDAPSSPAPAPAASGSATEMTETGHTVAVSLDPLPPGLKLEGTYRCFELKRPDGRYAARADGAAITNTSGATLRLRFTFTVHSGPERQTVGSPFELRDGQRVPSFTMASKSVAGHVSACELALASAGASAQDAAAVNAAAAKAGCSDVATHQDEGRDHIDTGETATYRTSPPTSGTHWASTNPPAPAPTGVHDEPIRNEAQVHNLEHGHVGVQYRNVGASTRAALEAAGREDASWILVAPYPDMQSAVALTAWTVSLTCRVAPKDSSALADLVRAFVRTYKNHGPESIPGRAQNG